MGSLFSRRGGSDGGGNQRKQPSRVNEQDKAVLVCQLAGLKTWFLLFNFTSGIEGAERQAKEVPKEGKNLAYIAGYQCIDLYSIPDWNPNGKRARRSQTATQRWQEGVSQLQKSRIFDTMSSNNRRAKLLLKKKRYLESLLDKTDQQLDNLQQMVENIEFAQIEIKVAEGLKTGNKCLEEMHKIMSLEDVENIMAETQEAIEYQRVRDHQGNRLLLHKTVLYRKLMSCLDRI